jgi:hypothetical protein
MKAASHATMNRPPRPPKSVSEKYSAQPAGIFLLFVTHFMTEAPAKKTKQTKN